MTFPVISRFLDDVTTSIHKGQAVGSALGPDWADGLAMKGATEVTTELLSIDES